MEKEIIWDNLLQSRFDDDNNKYWAMTDNDYNVFILGKVKPSKWKLSNGTTTTSLAEKMFDELGFEKLITHDDNCISYQCNIDSKSEIIVTFNICDYLDDIDYCVETYKNDICVASVITPELHEAISQQIKELKEK